MPPGAALLDVRSPYTGTVIGRVPLTPTAGVAQALGKLALDSTIQGSVPEQQRTSAFARSETLLQLSWVVGGFIGIALPLIPRVGLGTLAALMVGWTVLVVGRSRGVVTEAPQSS